MYPSGRIKMSRSPGKPRGIATFKLGLGYGGGGGRKVYGSDKKEENLVASCKHLLKAYNFNGKTFRHP